MEIAAEIVLRNCASKACGIAMWDADLESYGHHRSFGAQALEMQKVLQDWIEQDPGSIKALSEIDPEDLEADVPDVLKPVIIAPIKDKDELRACIFIAGAENMEWAELEATLSTYPLSLAFTHAWDYRELSRENDRLRAQYEQLEDSGRALEEQTRKLIHDMMAKDALDTIKLRRDRLVFSISNKVRSSVKIQEVLSSAVNEIGTTLGVTHCLLVRPLPDADGHNVYEYYNQLHRPLKPLFSTPDGLRFIEKAMSRQAPQALADPSVDAQTIYDPNFLRQLGLLSGVIVPLIYREQVLGVLFLQESAMPREWSIDDMSLLNALADNLSVGIENADLHEQRERQAVTDGLTSIANRRHFNDVFYREFERASRYQQPLSLVVVDLDYLKKINDTFGHQAGDNAIVAIAKVMQQSSRSIDLPARYGGEEFCLLLPNTDLEMAEQIAERLRKLINEIKIEGPDSISASIGVASFPVHATEADELFKQADEALYQAKQSGRNRVCIAQSQN